MPQARPESHHPVSGGSEEAGRQDSHGDEVKQHCGCEISWSAVHSACSLPADNNQIEDSKREAEIRQVDQRRISHKMWPIVALSMSILCRRHIILSLMAIAAIICKSLAHATIRGVSSSVKHDHQNRQAVMAKQDTETGSLNVICKYNAKSKTCERWAVEFTAASGSLM